MSLAVFDWGGSSVKYAFYKDEELTDKGSFQTPDSLDVLVDEMEKVISKKTGIEGIAISAPGSVNQPKRVIEGISAIPYIHFTPIYDLLEECFGVPVAIENDANCAGLCEVGMGAAKDAKNVAFFILGTGMGGSVFINRELHSGSHQYGGEFGMTLNSNGKTGSENGTLVAVSKRYNEKMGMNIDGIELLRRHDAGESEATEAINGMFDYIAEVIYNVQVIVDPDIVVLGGGISNRETLPKELSSRLDILLAKLDIMGAKPKIVNAKYQNDANLLGAVVNYQKNNAK